MSTFISEMFAETAYWFIAKNPNKEQTKIYKCEERNVL